LFVVFDESKHYFDTTVGFFGLENIGLAYIFKFLSQLEAEKSKNTLFYGGHFENPKIQNGGLNDVCTNANINFWIPYALMIPKMYRFANLQKF